MGWDENIDIEDYIICGSKFAGPVALLLKDKEKNKEKNFVQTVSNSNHMKNNIHEKTNEIKPEEIKSILSLYSAAGLKMVDIDWENRNIAGMGWSDKEELVIVLKDGR